MSNLPPPLPHRTASSGAQNMMEVGQDISGVDRARLAARRVKKGECATCGTKLFRMQGMLGKKQIPLSVPGVVLDGKCLICYPLDHRELKLLQQQQQQNFQHPDDETVGSIRVPRILTVDDDATVVSAITIENNFGGRYYYDREPSSAEVVPSEGTEPPLHRPGTSSRSDADLRPSPPSRQQAADVGDHSPRGAMSAPKLAGSTEPSWGREASGGSRRARNMGLSAVSEHGPVQEATKLDEESLETFQNIPGLEEESERSSIFPDNASALLPPDSIVASIHADEKRRRTPMETGEEKASPSPVKPVRSISPLVAHSNAPTKPNIGTNRSQKVPSDLKSTCSSKGVIQTVGEVAVLIGRLGSSVEEGVEDLESLTDIMWNLGGPAKQAFLDHKGVETLSTMIWTHMDNSSIVAASAGLMLALAAYSEDDRDVHVITVDISEGLMDAWLISLQTSIADEALQELGCRIFCCLSAASGSFNEINDGTSSGSVQSVLNAMDTHRDSDRIQEWGIRALYNQCVYSGNAEPNKRFLANGRLDSGARGSEVLNRILSKYDSKQLVVEWCAKLYWILSASVDVATSLVETFSEPMRNMIKGLHVLKSSGLASVQEAFLGTLSNFTPMMEALSGTDETQLALFLLENIEKNVAMGDVCQQACLLLTALTSRGIVDRNALITEGGVRILVTCMMASREKGDLIESSLRALVSLTLDCVPAKEEVCQPRVVSSVLKLCKGQRDNIACQEICCSLFASLFAADIAQRKAIQDDAVDFLCLTMSRFPNSEKLQDAGCGALRNLSCYEDSSQTLLEGKVVGVLTSAMGLFFHNISIQMNACCVLWNLKTGFNEETGDILTDDDLKILLSSLQQHLTESDFVHMACGALWSNIHDSDELRLHLVSFDGGVDAIACVLVIHSDNEEILYHACGILTSLTVQSKMVEGVIRSDGFTNMMDIMTNGQASLELLKYGSVFMRNICFAFPHFADESEKVVPVILSAMKDHADDAGFQREACSFLWLVAAQSPETKSKILALDGVTLLMSVLESYSGVEMVEEAALGAFRELALSAKTT